MPAESDDSFDFLGSAGHERRGGGSAVATKPLPAPRREDFPFLIAEHAFDARSLDAAQPQRDPQAVCLSFDAHELFYVHFVHASGWGDVTRVRSGERGWIPIDYFAGFSDARAIPLLAAIAAFLAKPRSQRLFVSPQRVFTFNEAAINEIISGTKLLLAKTNTLSRDAALVQQFPGIAGGRKALLTELAHLVHVAKHNKHSTDDLVIDKLVRGCYRLLERTLALLDGLDEQEVQDAVLAANTAALLASSSNNASAGSGPGSAGSAGSGHGSGPGGTNLGHAGVRASSGSSRSSASIRSGISDLDSHSLYRMNSFSDYSEPPQPQPRLREVATALATYLDQFMAPNSLLLANPESPQTSPAILALTRHCMLACRELLVVLDLMPDGELERAAGYTGQLGCRDELLEEIRRLVSSARSVVATLPPSPASLRTVAAQSMAAAAARCRELALDAARACVHFLQAHPRLSLPADRSYPVFAESADAGLRLLDGPAASATSVSSVATGPASSTDSVAGVEAGVQSEFGPELTEPATQPLAEPVTQPLAKPLADELHAVTGPVEGRGDDDTWATPTIGGLSPQVSPKSELSPAKVRSPARPAARSDTAGTSGTTGTTGTTGTVGSAGDTTGTTVADADAYADTSAFSFNTSDSSAIAEPAANADELVMRNDRVRGGSLRALVHWLAGDGWAELEFETRAFLLSFRLFATARDVVIELGSLEPSPGVRHLAQLWVESFWDADDQVLASLAPMVPQASVDARRRLLETRKNAQVVDLPLQPAAPVVPSARSTSTNSSTSSLTSYMRRNPSLGAQFSTQFGTQSALNLAASFREFGLGARRASRQASVSAEAEQRQSAQGYVVPTEAIEYLLSKSPAEFGSQITLMWFDVFRAMRPAELLDQRFSSAKRPLGLAPHVTQLVLSSNHLTAFVGDTVLSPSLSTKQRARVLKHWIRVADELFAHGNLNGTVTIVLTLQSTRIVRLSKAWESLSNKSHAILAKLQPFTSPERNFSEYRKELRARAGQPCVPYIGILLSDLTFIDEGNPKVLKPTMAINFDRYLKMAMAIATVQPFQLSQFDFAPDAGVQAWIRGHMARSYTQDTQDSNDQWRRSLLIQPD